MSIRAADLIAKFQYALDNHWGYIWGTAGGIWTQAEQDAATRDMIKKFGMQWVGRHVVDCSGLFAWAFKELGGYMYHGSNTMYNKYCTDKGSLIRGHRADGLPILPGTAVFTGTDDDRGHVGLYIGNNEVIEAATTQYGVIKSPISEEKWKWWGELKGVDYNGSQDATQPATEYLTVRKGSRGEAVQLLQTRLNEKGFDCGKADGIFGYKTLKAVKDFQQYAGLVIDGIVGPKTWAALYLQTAEDGKRYTVTISGVNKEQASALLRMYPEADVKEGG